MQKCTFDYWKNSMSFMIDDEFDTSFLGSIEPLTIFMNQAANQFVNAASLRKFLLLEDEFGTEIKLKAFISLIGLSEERLKRAVSLVRYKFYQQEFRSEWTVKQISRKIVEDNRLCELLMMFFIEGRNSEIGAEIPLYYMRNFNLKNIDFITDLKNFNYVNRILNDNEIQGKYSNRVGAHVEQLISNRLDFIREHSKKDLEYQVQKEFPLLNKNIDFLIPSVDMPILLIEASYNVTTGSGQSKRADQLVELYGILMKHNANHRNRRIKMINYCDGFGWVGRQNDLHRIYDASDYVINQNNLHLLDEIIETYC